MLKSIIESEDLKYEHNERRKWMSPEQWFKDNGNSTNHQGTRLYSEWIVRVLVPAGSLQSTVEPLMKGKIIAIEDN